MSDRIEGSGRAGVCEWSREEETEPRACHEPPEVTRARSDREAQIRAERWAQGEGERGMSTKQGTSQLSPTPQTSEGLDADEQRRVDNDNRKRLQLIDHPLDEDPIGNAIPGLLAGGIPAGVEAAAGRLGARAVAGAVAGHAIEHVEADALTHAHAAHSDHGTHGTHHAATKQSQPMTKPTQPTTKPAEAPKTSTATPALQPHVPAGQSSASGLSSESVKEPTGSVPPPVLGRDRSPYAPGTAPVCIPERPVVIHG